MRKSLLSSFVIPVLAAVVLAGCSPSYNWRDYNSPDAPFQAMFPDKPATHTRSVNLDGMTVEHDDDGGRNRRHHLRHRQRRGARCCPGPGGGSRDEDRDGQEHRRDSHPRRRRKTRAINIEAKGAQNGVPMRLVGHFEARGKRFYQVIVMGKEKSVPQDQVDMFMSSFKLL